MERVLLDHIRTAADEAEAVHCASLSLGHYIPGMSPSGPRYVVTIAHADPAEVAAALQDWLDAQEVAA